MQGCTLCHSSLGLSMAVWALSPWLSLRAMRASHVTRMHVHMHAAKRSYARALQPRMLHPRPGALVQVLAHQKDAVAAVVASRHSEHKSEARAAGERVDVGALA